MLTGLYPKKICFVVLIAGFTPMDSAVDGLFPEEKISVPSLHILGTEDPFVSVERGEMLAGRFLDPTVLTHGGGHIMPPKGLLKEIKEWVRSFKN